MTGITGTLHEGTYIFYNLSLSAPYNEKYCRQICKKKKKTKPHILVKGPFFSKIVL